MPTKSNLLIKGDRLSRKNDGATYRVVKRIGASPATYAVMLEREDREPITIGGTPRTYWTLTNAHWHVFQQENGEWKLLGTDMDALAMATWQQAALAELCRAVVAYLDEGKVRGDAAAAALRETASRLARGPGR